MSPPLLPHQTTDLTIKQILQEARLNHQKGKCLIAEKQYLSILEIEADHPEANYFLGLLALKKNRPADSLKYFETALDKQPDTGYYWLSYIEALDQSGQSDIARDILEMARQAGLEGIDVTILMAKLDSNQENNDRLYQSNQLKAKEPPNKSFVATPLPQKDIDTLIDHYRQNRLTECETIARSILKHFPTHGLSWKILGAVLKQQNRPEEAISAMKQAVFLMPNDHESLNNLGLTLQNEGQLVESEAVLRRAIELNRDFAEGYNNLGTILMSKGDYDEAENCFHHAIRLSPDYTEAYCNLGVNLKDQGRITESEENLRHALKLRPSYADAYNNLGNVLLSVGRLSEAEHNLRKALELKPDFAVAYNNLGNTLQGQGFLEASELCYRKALELNPNYSEAFDGLLFVSNYHPNKSGNEIFQLYQEYDQKFGLLEKVQLRQHRNSRDPHRRLKVGYVSPSFYRHPVFHFLEPLLEHHNSACVETYAYSETIREDQITLQYKQLFNHWRPTIGLSDEQLANQIQSDEIDILVDLAGHTGRNRLGVFALKPAPISLHWLDFGYTTGLTSIDYYLADIHIAPIGSESLFSERLWRLPVPPFTYRPAQGMGAVSPLPATKHGYITFGTLTRAIRLNDRTVRVWSEILKKVEGSRLVIDSGNFKDPNIQASLYEKFLALGIESNRLDIGFHSPPWDVLRNIDIGLDCFPHNSGTTLFENLYMGIPFVTLANRPGVGTLGCSILQGIGHPEWIADNDYDYIEKVQTLATNLSTLETVRANLRNEIQHCPLMDEQGFARAIEDAYRKMFQQWCEKKISEKINLNAIPLGTDNNRHSRQDTIASYNQAVDLQQQNRIIEAKNLYIQVLNGQPNLVEAYNNLGAIYQQQGLFGEAEACYSKAIEIKSDYTDAYYNLATCYKIQHKVFRSEAVYRKVVELQPDHANGHYNLGYILQEQGRSHEAEHHLRHALTIKPDHLKAFSTLLFTLNYHPDKSSDEIFRTYKEFNTQFFLALDKTWVLHSNSRQKKRRIKVGYMAPDYRKHPARYFLEPLLAHHDKNSFELYAYVELKKDAEQSDLFRQYVDHWVATESLTDEQLTKLIRQEEIDILIDLAGHTVGNRLGVFARKPAPVSLHWLDFGYSTGLTAMNYYLTDSTSVPVGSERYFSETPWRLAPPAIVYRPHNGMGPVSPLPALKNGFITFGTLTRAIRINHRTIRVWSEILKRCTGSHLIINSGSYRETGMQQALADQFLKHGIQKSRLEIGSNSPPWDILRSMDFGFDCFPHNSGTTLIESLYMGIPFVTLNGRPSVGTLGSSILEGIGHPEWIAHTEDQYVNLVVAAVKDLPGLAALRASLREEMESSPLMDEMGFTKKVETAYREMFQRWCDVEQAPITTTKKGKSVTPSKKRMKNKRNKEKHKKGHPGSPLNTELSTLNNLFNEGRYAEAYHLAESLTTRFPHDGHGWKVLGPLLHQQGKREEAIQAMQYAARCLPEDPDVHFNLGIAQQQCGLLEEAEINYHKTLRLNNTNIQAHFNLGNIMAERDRLEEAENYYRLTLSLKADYFEVHCNLGKILKAQGKLSESAISYRSALKIRHDSAEALSNLSLTLKEQGNFSDAEVSCKQALTQKPNFPEACNNLGLIYQEQGKTKEAEACYRQSLEQNPLYTVAHNNLGLLLFKVGRLTEAEKRLKHALQIDPDFNEAYINLGNIYLKQGKLIEAENILRRSLIVKPDTLKTLNNLAVTLNKLGENTEAEEICRRIIKLHPEYPKVYHNFSNILSKQQMFNKAEEMLRKSLDLNPDSRTTYDNLLFLLNYDPDKTAEEIFTEYKNFNEHFAMPLQDDWLPHRNEIQLDRRLRVGYVGSQFHRHSARHFLEPLLENHDKTKVEIYAYAELLKEDEQTHRYRNLVDHWIDTPGMTDADVADRIRKDRIDILVDLAGHTEANRLTVFALKPAPVSLHWLDFGYTTGLTAIDYYLTDHTSVPPGNENLFSEIPWRLEGPCIAYRPADNMGDIGTLPATKRGHVTFGTLTRAVRINHRTIRVWSEILKRVKGAQLVIDSRDFIDPKLQNGLIDKFISSGVQREQIKIGFHSPPWDIMRGMDICFDCFPHNSGTTLIESLYMGVPYITLADRPSVGTLGSSILANIGHPEWIAKTEEEYIDLAIALATDLPHLSKVRQTLRQEMVNSPLMDEPAFARKVEAAYYEMFACWSKSQPASQSLSVPINNDDNFTPSDQNILNEAEIKYQDGHLQQAKHIYQILLDQDQENPEINHRLGCIAVNEKQPAAALPYLERAVTLQPNHGGYWLSYIDALDKLGKTDAAIELLEMAIQEGLQGEEAEKLLVRISVPPPAPSSEQMNIIPPLSYSPVRQTSLPEIAPEPSPEETLDLISLFQQERFAEAEPIARALVKRFRKHGFSWKALGAILKTQGRLDEALSALQEALKLSPDDIEVFSHLGEIYQKQGMLVDAENIYRKTIKNHPLTAQPYYSLANILIELGRQNEAETYYRKAIELKADFAEAYYNLGNLLKKQNQLDESAKLYQEAIRNKADYYKAYSNLGIVLQTQGKLENAENCYRKAIEIHPEFVEAHINLGACLKEQGFYAEAEKSYHMALAIQPDSALCYSNLGSVLKEHGQLDKAEEALRQALAIKPNFTEAHDNLLFLLNYHPDKSGEEIFSEYQEFDKKFGISNPAARQAFSNDRQPNRRLKIGYVSPQFRLHSIRHFLEPLLAHHDKNKVEIFAYADNSDEDEFTAKYRTYVDQWRKTVDMKDIGLAETIRTDGIDILVDLAGHTAHNRLQLFALKPAPISLHWLDFGYTTGISAIDYYLTDHSTVPESYDNLFSETPWRMETPSFVYRPAEGMGAVSSLPARQNGYVTFGTLTRAVRINHRTIRAWAEILKQVEESHLVIDSSNFKDTAMQEELATKFVCQGIARERLEIGYHSPPWDVLRNLDISLDCFPHNSGTTLVETLYMGVPFITMAHRPSVGRLGSSILHAIGHPEWIAGSEDEYIQLATALAADTQKLASLRTSLRYEMERSSLMDEAGFARKVETAYRMMFTNWSKGDEGVLLQENKNKMTPPSTAELMYEADVLYKAGQLQEAQDIYQQILFLEPQHPEANFQLGCVIVAARQPEAALAYFATAVDVRAEHGPYWVAYINALDLAGQSDSAGQLLEMAIQAGLDGEEVEVLAKRLTSSPASIPPRKANTKKQKKERKKITQPQTEKIDCLLALFQQGNLIDAKALGLSLIDSFPKSGLIWKVLGAIHRQQGSMREALEAMEKSLALMPDDYICMRNISVLLGDQKKYLEAERYCRNALELKPDYADGHNTLSIILRSQQRLIEAECSCKKALMLMPDSADTHVNLGLILNEDKRFSEAESSYKQAIELNPNSAEAYCGLGIALQAADRIIEAEAACRQALTLRHDFPAAHNCLGGILNEQEKFNEAESAYRLALHFKPVYPEALHNLGRTLYNQNRYLEAESCYRKLLQIEPENAEAYYNLANTLADQEKTEEAEFNYHAALQIKPDYPELYINLGNTLRLQGWLTKAEASYRKALRYRPNYQKAYNNLASILQEQGLLAESEEVFRLLLQSSPEFPEAFGNLLFLLNYHPDKSGREIFQEYIRFNEQFGLPLQAEWRPHQNNAVPNRRLKIGYVSPQFCKHPVCNFLEPLLNHQNKNGFELYGYAELYKEDEATVRYRSYMDHWIPTKGMTDAELADRIRNDGIDILVDLAGHTGHNRLLVFARKPAPISLHWLDFGYTTGLSAIDYYLTDHASVPDGSEGLFAETPWQIQTPCLAYRPTPGMGEVSVLPATRQGYITFGSLSRAVRINYKTIRVWARLLQRVEGSHLIINSGNFKDPEMQKKFTDKFGEYGIAPDRLEIGCSSPPWEVLRNIDIGLDCFPHNSGTTLFETLYMGIPFVTLSGRPSIGTLGCTVLKGVGHPEWIAKSENEYIEIASALANDPDKLATLRAGLRQEMQNSPLMDEPALARKIEAAYREMFIKWCQEQS